METNSITDNTSQDTSQDTSPTLSKVDDADMQLVMNQCGVSMEKACELLNQANGDLVEAIAFYLNPELQTSTIHKKNKEWDLISSEDLVDPEIQKAREVQDKLAELREITKNKNKILDEQLQNRHTTPPQPTQ